MKIPNLKIAALIVATIMSISSHAVTIFTLADTRLIGQITPGTSTATEDNAAYVNSLVDRSHGISPSSFDFAENTYLLFNTQGGTLTYAEAAAATSGAVGGDHLVAGVTGYEYLVVKYDGANGEAYVFNVAGITGDVQVPATDPRKNTHNKYLLFNAAGTTRVPDGGITAIMLGLGFAAMGMVSRRNRI